MQEAKKKSVTATDAEIEAAVQLIEKQNNMHPGQLNEFLKAQHIDRGSLVDQLTASIVWGKLVRRLGSESIEISDEEVDEAMKRAQEHANEPEARVAEILLAVDTPAQEGEVKALADRLIEQMHKGARFSAVAQQFSQSATAAVGGDIGWIQPDQLAPELGKAVANMKPGELSPPVRSGAGYYLLLVLDRRGAGAAARPPMPPLRKAEERCYDIVQVVFPLPPSPRRWRRSSAAVGEAETVRNGTAKTCAPTCCVSARKRPRSFRAKGQLRASTISPQMREMINRLGMGHASPPIVQRNGVGVIMVCGKACRLAGAHGGGAAEPIKMPANRRDRGDIPPAPGHDRAPLSARPAPQCLCRHPCVRLTAGRRLP